MAIECVPVSPSKILVVENAGDQVAMVPRSFDDVRHVISNNDNMTMVGLATRPGLTPFLTALEHSYFKPLTTANDLFSLLWFNWPDKEDSIFVCAVIPFIFKTRVEHLAEQYGLRILEANMIMFTNGKQVSMDLGSAHAFSIENTSGHPVYENQPGALQDMLLDDMSSAKNIAKNASKERT